MKRFFRAVLITAFVAALCLEVSRLSWACLHGPCRWDTDAIQILTNLTIGFVFALPLGLMLLPVFDRVRYSVSIATFLGVGALVPAYFAAHLFYVVTKHEVGRLSVDDIGTHDGNAVIAMAVCGALSALAAWVVLFAHKAAGSTTKS